MDFGLIRRIENLDIIHRQRDKIIMDEAILFAVIATLEENHNPEGGSCV